MLRHSSTLLAGKAVRLASRLRGGGSALPGLVVEKIDPGFLARTLGDLPYGVVIISGTNGKTTTTKMVVELLRAQGLKVFTNPTGSNFKRGVISALIEKLSLSGRLESDIAVLELDEAHAVHFVREVKPSYSLLLNVMRDQLDRFGEIDKTAEMLGKIVSATTRGVVINREDARLERIAEKIDKEKVSFFGLSDDLLSHFPSDDELYGKTHPKKTRKHADVRLESFEGNKAVFQLGENRLSATLKLNGVYNIFNAAAAIALLRKILGEKLDQNELLDSLQNIESAFGRGEKLKVDGQDLELVLIKNPSGFRLGLSSFKPEKNIATMIAINDNYADGRDMSWLWDVDFSSLQKNGVTAVSGIRAYDMALRLNYDDVSFDMVEPNRTKALRQFIKKSKGQNKRIFCTYTAMLQIRKLLEKYTDMERIL